MKQKNSIQNDTLVTRLRLAMQRRGLNARELAEQASVGASFVYDILSGKSSNPTSRKLSSVATVLEIDLMYLLYGIEEMHVSAETAASAKHPSSLYVGIPSLTVVSSASGGAVVVDETIVAPYYFQKHWLRDALAASATELRVVFLHGDAMVPALHDGDMILVDTSRNLPSPAGVFVVFDGVGLVAKRLEMIGKKKIRVLSDNPSYGAYESTLDDLQIIGRVVWFARTL